MVSMVTFTWLTNPAQIVLGACTLFLRELNWDLNRSLLINLQSLLLLLSVFQDPKLLVSVIPLVDRTTLLWICFLFVHNRLFSLGLERGIWGQNQLPLTSRP